MMKAWVLHNVNDLRYEDVDIPILAEDEVRIKVRAAGICGSDIPRIYETGAHKMPLICGHEFAGVVEGIGKKVPPYWMGKRVAVFPKIACLKCKECLSGHTERCQNYDYLGSRRNGAFAEYVVSPFTQLLELPDSVSFEQAAMLEPMAVAANAFLNGCRRVNPAVSLDANIVVCGLGTIGLLLCMFLVDAGYRNIYVIGNKASQIDKAKNLGIPEDRFYNCNDANVAGWIMDVTDGGTEVYFECVGKNESICYGLEAIAPAGRIILVGNPYSDMSLAKDTYWNILRNQVTICGIWNSTFAQTDVGDDTIVDDWNYVLRRLEKGSIHPEEFITHTFAIDELEKGLLIMRDKKEYYCKVMMVNS